MNCNVIPPHGTHRRFMNRGAKPTMDHDTCRTSNTRRSTIASISLDGRVDRERAIEVEASTSTEPAVVTALSTGDVGRLRAMCIAEAETPHPNTWRRVDGRRRSDGVASQLLSTTASEWLLRKRLPLGKP